MKYRLTEDNFGFKKGHVFVLKDGDEFKSLGGHSVTDVELSLLLKTGILEEVKEEEWPQKKDQYWVVDDEGCVFMSEWDNLFWEKKRKKFGNCFRTKEEALEASEQIKTLLLSLKK